MSTDTPEARLEAMGLSLPPPPSAVANYVGLVKVGRIAFVSGHGPVENGELTFIGKLGRDMDVETGKKAAQLTMLNLLATLAADLGGLDRVERVVKLLVMVNSTPDFAEQPFVANGASDLLVEIFGPERGRHARSAVGLGALPFGISVEIEGIFEIRE